MNASRQEPKYSPLMLAWEAFKQTPEYLNAEDWAQHCVLTHKSGRFDMLHPTLDGSLWAMFKHGFLAAQEAAAKVAEGGRFLHDDSPEVRFGKQCADAIRRMRDA